MYIHTVHIYVFTVRPFALTDVKSSIVSLKGWMAFYWSISHMRKAFHLARVATVLVVLKVCPTHANPLAVSNYEAPNLKWIISIRFMQHNNNRGWTAFVGHKQFHVLNLASSLWGSHNEKATARVCVSLGVRSIQLPFCIHTRPLCHIKVKGSSAVSKKRKTVLAFVCLFFSIGR